MTRASLFGRAVVAASVIVIALPVMSGSAVAGGNGMVRSWGLDFDGQVGDGLPGTNRPSPVTVSGMGAGSDIVSVAAGTRHSLAVRADGSVFAWGSDLYGQRGDGVSSNDGFSPVAVSGLGAGSGVVAVSAGDSHSLALRRDGTVLAWGNDEKGQLGDGGVNSNQTIPIVVSGLGAGSGVVGIAAGHFHSLAWRGDGSVVAWGYDGSGQLGDGGTILDQPTPVAVTGLGAGSGITRVVAGFEQTLAVRANGSVLSWGSDSFGQLGDGAGSSTRSTPGPVSGLGVGSGVVDLAAGFEFSLARRADGSVLAWGSDILGQQGDGGANTDRFVPGPVSGLGAGSGVMAIAAGYNHGLAVRADGSVLAWGSDGSGQQGDGGTNVGRSTPGPVSGLGAGSGVMAVAAGGDHSLTANSPGPTFAPLSPARVWDTRFGPGPIGRVGAGATRDVTVAGVGGVPANGVTSVVLNVTAVNPSAFTFITAWPTGETKPLASNLNIPAGDVRPNQVIVKIGSNGRVSFFNDAGTTDLIADVAGWYGVFGGQRYTPLAPARLWDSRFGPGPVGKIGPGGTANVTVTGIGGVPAAGVTAIALNVTGVNPSAATFITAWPTGETKPLASNLNIPPADVRPNLVIVKVGAGGQVSFFNAAGATDLIADVAGYYGPTGASFNSLSPARLWDSRVGPGPIGRVPAGGVRSVNVTNIGGVPAAGVDAVVLNATAVNPSAATFVTVWPAGSARPLASNLNVPPGDVRANLVIVKVGAGGQVSFFNDAGTVDLIVDVAGWYGAAGT